LPVEDVALLYRVLINRAGKIVPRQKHTGNMP
jgi:hypothetical protein